jgi:hypothetical protein
MIYHYESTIEAAERYLKSQQRRGYRGYVLCLNDTKFEIRTWR